MIHRRALLAAPLLHPALAQAQADWPGSRPVRVIHPSVAGSPGDVYVFRFRPAGAPVDNWLIGIAGPYARAEQPTVADYGYTYSVFCHQDECDVDEHISRIAHTVNASVAGSPGR